MGKTALSVKFAQQVQSQFDFVIWRSLQQAPSLSALLSDILPILAGIEVTTDSLINTLMKQLRSKRCLLVLDNVESILQDGNRGGQYQPGYEAYRQLFARICDEPHQSCLILTGRDKPGGFALGEGKNLAVKSLQLLLAICGTYSINSSIASLDISVKILTLVASKIFFEAKEAIKNLTLVA